LRLTATLVTRRPVGDLGECPEGSGATSEVTYTLGIDVGTTYTGAATARGGRARIFSLGHDRPASPTMILVRENGEILVGEPAERRSHTETTRMATGFKRRMGDTAPVMVGGTPYGVDALFGHVLRWVHNLVLAEEDESPESVTLTHPASWGGFKLDVLQQAARLGGLESVEFLSEPQAAAVHYAAEVSG